MFHLFIVARDRLGIKNYGVYTKQTISKCYNSGNIKMQLFI